MSVGVPVEDLLAEPDNAEWPNYSIEFCGGTHLPRPGMPSSFASSPRRRSAKGVRRITALTGDAASGLRGRRHELAGSDAQVDTLKDAPTDSSPIACRDDSARSSRPRCPGGVKRKIREGGELGEGQGNRKGRGKGPGAAIVDRARELAEQSEGPVIVTAQIDDATTTTLCAPRWT